MGLMAVSLLDVAWAGVKASRRGGADEMQQTAEGWENDADISSGSCKTTFGQSMYEAICCYTADWLIANALLGADDLWLCFSRSQMFNVMTLLDFVALEAWKHNAYAFGSSIGTPLPRVGLEV